ncbi:hypothetical protein ABZW03_25930 [Kitasatospora sp. NPDC004799]|uniref:hypothetical protein n=1 Tax=Kitasatospora sp. NPDC004799 TaxID=3154460 RepID=UPI0033B2A8C8
MTERYSPAVQLPSLDPGTGRRPPRPVPQQDQDAARARLLWDDHRSVAGECPRCDTRWPCAIATAARYGNTP